MNTTSPAVIPKIDDEQFGKLIELPKLYAAHKLSADNAKLATDKYLKPYASIPNIQTATFEEVEAILTPIRALRIKLDATEKKINAERSPHTRKMDAIGSLLIGNEKTVAFELARTKKAEDDWQLELLRRNRAAAAAAAKQVSDKQARIDRKSAIAKVINETFGKDLTDRVVAMHKKFYELDAPSLVNWINQMKKWSPLYDGSTVTRNVVGAADEILEVRGELYAGLTAEYADRCKKERDALVDLLAGRLEQLKQGSSEVIVDVDQFSTTVMKAVNEMNADVDDNAQKQSIEATFDAAGTTTVFVSEGGKGKTVKKKYRCDSIEALQAVMQSWVRHNMQFLSIEELNTKLSFMRTAADVRLNTPGLPILEAKGLSIVDDIKTRTQKQKTNES